MTEPNHEVERLSEPIVFEVISGVEGACLAAGQGEADTRIAGRKPWGGGTVIHTFRVPVDGFLRDVPAIQAAAKAQALAEVREALDRIADWLTLATSDPRRPHRFNDFPNDPILGPMQQGRSIREYAQSGLVEVKALLSTLEDTQGEDDHR